MTEEFERETPSQPEGSDGGAGARKLLPAGARRAATDWLAEWIARALDVVEMMADATREAFLKKRG